MKYTLKYQNKALGCLSLIALVCTISGAGTILGSVSSTHIGIDPETPGGPLSIAANRTPAQDPLFAKAVNLRQRLLKENMLVPPTGTLRNALRERQDILEQSITVTFDAGAGSPDPWEVRMSEHPEWLTLSTSLLSAHYEVDASLVEQTLRKGLPGMPAPTDAVAADVRDDKGVTRVTIRGISQRGYSFDEGKAAADIASAVRNRMTAVTIPTTIGGGGMTLELPDGGTKTLQLIGAGESDFAKSPPARIWNIQKALTERLNGIVIPAGKTFSFNGSLDTPITLQKGWKEALGIFGGGTSMTPGGGICQAATTTYRAAIFGGLPILERRSHSLFVTYYEQGGVGVDATIFPGHQNLTFENDTKDEIVMVARVDGTKAFVDLYGIPDGRKVVVEGPYFSSTPHRPSIMRPLGYDQIGWVQRVEYPDGRTREKVFISTYQKGIPSRVKRDYAVTQIENVHAAAPSATAEAPAPDSTKQEVLKNRT